MFNIFRKKTQVEKLLATDGIEHATERFSQIVSRKLTTRQIAYQFILEELDGASRGNAASQQFARNSGIASAEYRGALDSSIPEVDGPDGPQQLLLGLSLQIANQDQMAEFRCKVDDKIMRGFAFGRYAQKEDRTKDLYRSLKEVLMSDNSVIPALTPNIPVPTDAKVRHIHFREKSLASARELIANLAQITGDDSESIIASALAA